jgi:hypothetical protein
VGREEGRERRRREGAGPRRVFGRGRQRARRGEERRDGGGREDPAVGGMALPFYGHPNKEGEGEASPEFPIRGKLWQQLIGCLPLFGKGPGHTSKSLTLSN